MENVLNPYDDPYIMLAYKLLAILNTGDIKRIFNDEEFIQKMIIKETRNLDFCGPFLDTIVESILVDKRRMEMCRELDRLSAYFYDNLDLDRLRRELRALIDKYDIQL